MTKPTNILNDYELKAIVMSEKFDFNNFYKYELGKMINILKKEIKKLQQKDTYTNIVHNQFRIEKKEKRYYENILDELEEWLEEKSENANQLCLENISQDTNEKVISYNLSLTTKKDIEKVLEKIKELKGSDK